MEETLVFFINIESFFPHSLLCSDPWSVFVGSREQKTRVHVPGGPETSTCPFQQGIQNMLFNREGKGRDPSCQ